MISLFYYESILSGIQFNQSLKLTKNVNLKKCDPKRQYSCSEPIALYFNVDQIVERITKNKFMIH